MKKMKGGGKSETLDDARARYRHMSLLQDFQELQKGTEVAHSRLQLVKDKKLTLEAEVRFLRQRRNFLLKVRAQSHQKKQEKMLPHKLSVAARPPVPKFESSQKRKVHKKNGATPSTQNLSLLIDLNHNITKFNAPESSSSRNRVHQLDLNQIANDEEDFQTSIEPIRNSASAYCKGLTDEQLNDMKVSACRNIGSATSSRAGKRKISWQDQVALRV